MEFAPQYLAFSWEAHPLIRFMVSRNTTISDDSWITYSLRLRKSSSISIPEMKRDILSIGLPSTM
jgi:hypothetical protein